MNQGIKLPGDENIVEKAGAKTGAVVSNLGTDIADWWEDVRPGWIWPKQPKGAPRPGDLVATLTPTAADQPQPSQWTSASSSLQLPGSMSR